MLSTRNTSTLTISQLISIPSVNSSPLVKSHIKSPVSNFTHQSTRQSVNSSTSKFINQSSRPFANSSSSQVIHQIIRPSTKSSINHPLKRSFADSCSNCNNLLSFKRRTLSFQLLPSNKPCTTWTQEKHSQVPYGTAGRKLGCTNRPRPLLVDPSIVDSNLPTTFRPSF